MNLEIANFKKQIVTFDFHSELGFSFLEEDIYNENTVDVFFRYQLKNNLNKIISFTYYPCYRLLNSNEIEVVLEFPNASSTGLSEYLAYSNLNRKLNYEDVLPYRFKVDCDNLNQSISFQLKQISNLLHGEIKKYLVTEQSIFIPMQDPRDDY